MPLKIAIPNKGRLMEETVDLLRGVGLRVPRSTDRTPKLDACSIGTGRAATVTSAPVSRWKATIWFTSIR